MKLTHCQLLITAIVGLSVATSFAHGNKVIGESMKKFHKAPEGVDPVTKKVGAGTASEQEITDLLQSYQAIAKETPPKGDKAGWDQRTKAVIDALTLIQKKDPKGTEDFKKAINCKACHTEHKPK